VSIFTNSERSQASAGSAPRGVFRLLVVLAETVPGDALEGQVAERLRHRRGAVHLVSPAITGSLLKQAFGDVDGAIITAKERLESARRQLRRTGIDASGSVGESDPMVAIEDALATFPADEILIVTHQESEATPLERDLFARARERFEQPITHLSVERRDRRPPRVVDEERAGPGVEADEEREGPRPSANLPPLSMRDLAGILVAIFGTLVLVTLAATCGGSEVSEGSLDWGCVVRYILAGGAALINVAHVVGLMLFESVGYRGLGARAFAHLSLWGTPAAIGISLLVH
jgi:hypothetical protein